VRTHAGRTLVAGGQKGEPYERVISGSDLDRGEKSAEVLAVEFANATGQGSEEFV